MKTLVKSAISTFIVLLMCVGITHAQKFHKVNHDLSFEDESNTEEIVIEVKGKKSVLSIRASCKVKFGDVSIEIYDPKGVKQKHFSIGSKVRPKEPVKKKEAKTAAKASEKRKKRELTVKGLEGEVAYAEALDTYVFYSNHYSGGVRGQVEEKVKDPAAGKWIVKIIPKNATANVSVRASQKK